MDKTENEVVQSMAIAAVGVQLVEAGAKPLILIPNGYSIEDVEHTLARPTRKRGSPVFHDVASFIAHFNIHKISGSRIFGQVETPKFIAVLNDHEQGIAGWGDHKATYACPLSKEWKAWKQFAGTPRDQIAFAEFIETNMPDIFSTGPDEPSAADMLQIATSFKAQKKVNFASGQRLDNGQVDFTFVEDLQGTAGPKGSIKVPERFFIAVPVFEGGSPYKIEAKLRWRLKDGSLTMWFDLVRDHKVLEAAFMDVWKEIAEGTETIIWRGTPA